MAVPVVGNGAIRQLMDNAGVEAVGEVQDIPTPYTMLRRLKDIADAVSGSSSVDARVLKGLAVPHAVKTMADWGFDAADLNSATEALITAHSNAVNYTLDGTDPTTTLGHHLPSRASMVVTGNLDIVALKFIRSGLLFSAQVSITLFY